MFCPPSAAIRSSNSMGSPTSTVTYKVFKGNLAPIGIISCMPVCTNGTTIGIQSASRINLPMPLFAEPMVFPPSRERLPSGNM
nr:hypothetical protein Iba_chr10dCG9680 [Ipomoea batatas]